MRKMTPAERDLWDRLWRMLIAGRRAGMTVDECIRAVHTDRLLEQGFYDAYLAHHDRIEEAFANRRYLVNRRNAGQELPRPFTGADWTEE